MIINYFPHDSNARSDNKIIALRMKYGWEGYGLFWALVEKLRDSTQYRLAADYDALAYDLRTEAQTIHSIIHDFGLFVVDAGHFQSDSLLRRMELKDDRSARSREAALARWHKPSCAGNADAQPSHNPGIPRAASPQSDHTPQAASPQSDHTPQAVSRQSDRAATAEQGKETKPQKSKPKSISTQSPAEREERERVIFETFLLERSLPTARDETIRFLDFYDSRGWLSGNTQITDAGAAARLWEPRPKPTALPEHAAATLHALYTTLGVDSGFKWREFAVSGGVYDHLSCKLVLNCTRAFGARVRALREPILEAVAAVDGAAFRLIYNQE